jgi:ATP-dependent DNA helicase RecQ
VNKNNKQLKEYLVDKFKYPDFRYPQQEIIERSLADRSTLALMPTGAGKSLPYQFVASLVEKQELVLVVSPLIALMQDQTNKANEFNISSTYINSALSLDQKKIRLGQIKNGEYQLLFVVV